MRYLLVNPPQLRVLVEQQELLLVAGGDGHALRDQSHLLLRRQQPVPRGAGVAGPAGGSRWGKRGREVLCERVQRPCAINRAMMKNNSRGFFH